MATFNLSGIPPERLNNPSLQDLFFARGDASYFKDRPDQGLNKYFPVKVTQAKLPADGGYQTWGMTPTPSYGDPVVGAMGWNAPKRQDEMLVDPKTFAKGPRFAEYVKRHEESHLLSGRNTGKGVGHPLYQKKNIATGDVDMLKYDLVKAINANRQELFEKFPELKESGYMLNPANAALEEIMADLNSLEENYGIDITKDPLFHKVFRSTRNKELYNASSGYRRTRMDARDPEPYNPKGYK